MKKYLLYSFTMFLAFTCVITIVFIGLVTYGNYQSVKISPSENSKPCQLHFHRFYFSKKLFPMSCRAPKKIVSCVFIYKALNTEHETYIAWSPFFYDDIRTPIRLDSP